MSLWRPPLRPRLPLARVGRALWPYRVSISFVHCGGEGWQVIVDRLKPVQGGLQRVLIGHAIGPTEIEALIAALPMLPGIAVRLAILEMLL